MAKSKTQADPGESRIGHSPPSEEEHKDRPRKGGSKRKDGAKGTPKVGKRDVGGGGGKPLH